MARGLYEKRAVRNSETVLWVVVPLQSADITPEHDHAN